MSLGIVEEIRRMVKQRPRILESVRGGSYTQLGEGRIIENISRTAQELISTIQARRPKVIPTVVERIKTYEPGRLIKTVTEEVSKTVTTTQASSAPTVTSTAGILRRG